MKIYTSKIIWVFLMLLILEIVHQCESDTTNSEPKYLLDRRIRSPGRGGGGGFGGGRGGFGGGRGGFGGGRGFGGRGFGGIGIGGGGFVIPPYYFNRRRFG